jgi:hypothetical protein
VHGDVPVSKTTAAASTIRHMATEPSSLIGPDDTAYRVELTPAQLKVTWVALKSMLDGYGHDELDVRNLVRSVLQKLPPEESIRSIDLQFPRGRPRL